MDLKGRACSASLSRAAIADLRRRVIGPVVLPHEPGYAAECATFNLLSVLRPAIAVGASRVADVQAAVHFAAERDMPVAVLATGHQMVGSAAGAVLINMARMNTVAVDPAQRLARAEGGARWRRVLDAADPYGLAPLNGSSPLIGVAGYHLGGGASPILGRRYGYATDHVQAIDVVTADGALRRASAGAEPDLFWALRGGKSNFGVVTALEFAVFPVKRFYGGGLFFAGENTAAVLHAWRTWAVRLPPEMSSSLGFLRLPPLPTVPQPLRGRFVLHLHFASLGPREESERSLAPMRAVAPAIMDTLAELPYREAASLFSEPREPAPSVSRGTMLRALPREAADAIVVALGPNSGTPLGFAELRLLGGALAAPPAVPDAVHGRGACWHLFAAGGGPAEFTPLFEEHLDALVEAMAPWAYGEIGPNLLGERQALTRQVLRASYGSERFDRLAAIKAHYDPRNLFRVNHNIGVT